MPNLDIIPGNSYDADEFYLEDGFLRYGEDSRVGIDVSSHQGEIDWEAVATSGVEFAIIRAGYRGYSEGELFVDPFFFENIEGALENGLDVGVYFFSQALNTEEALEEAEFLLEAVEGYELALPVVFDWERISYDGGPHGRGKRRHRHGLRHSLLRGRRGRGLYRHVLRKPQTR